ncbi:MAG: N-6 DNA methylase [Bacteroidales bacterium]|nr:N-6 DNA methylase [Bacteroidales bacterium]
MKPNKEEAYKKIAQLVERFNEHVEGYKRDGYNEHQTRVDYINPFFKALGWDMDNEQGYAEAYREVIHEDKIKIGSSTKAPDYGFTLFGQRKFFVDAKKPAINIKSDLAPAYQVRRYGWSAKVPISIVTDFEEFSIYDCTKKPKPTDKASVARIKYITYDQYLDEFDFLWDVFAKENLPKGRFDKYVQSDTRRKGTATVDDEFLKSIEQWRTYLATTIALRNKSLNEDEINYAVQKIIDRILFLRMCEDRGVEQYGELKKAAVKGEIYQNLFALYHKADDKYNSGLFDFKEDKITPTLIVDNKVMKNIIKELYYPNCEYEFSVMPADILGSVYEQFLGKTIRLTKAHYAKVEEKPEVRKAGGVYYTPKYVVDYIVENTVGKLIEGKTPKQVEKIRICDPACGSGSFLIGAYQFLLDWHLKYYTNDPPKKKKDNPLTPDGNLTTAEKKRILLNNIFGVDIDAQAVEVTKLNLLLKALEGETQASISQQLALFQERVLPNLYQNIKCGNSLIGPDFYDDQLDLFPEQMKKINAFDWEMGFPEIFKQDGFDIVIGNPPYLMVQPHNTEANILAYYKNNYRVAEFKIDLFHMFMQKGISILRNFGLFGYIIPSSILNNVYAETLREWMLEHVMLRRVSVATEKVFADADVYSVVITAEKERNKTKRNQNIVETAFELEKARTNKNISYSSVRQERFSQANGKVWNILISETNVGVIAKIQQNSEPLSEVTQINRGLITGDKKKFFTDNKVNEKYEPILAGGDVKRYYSNKPIQYVLFEKPPKSGGCWDPNVHLASHKIVIRQIGTQPTATLIEKPYAVTGNIFTIIADDLSTEKFILGILNSAMIKYFWRIMFSDFKNSFPQVTIFSLGQVPIININERDKADRKLEEEIVKHVDNLLKLNEQLQTTKLETQRQQIQRTIDHTEKKIDELVYGLYGLSEEEVKIIEQS